MKEEGKKDRKKEEEKTVPFITDYIRPCEVFYFPQHVGTGGEGERGWRLWAPPGQLLNRSCHSQHDSVCWQEAQEPMSPSHKGLIAALTFLTPRSLFYCMPFGEE